MTRAELIAATLADPEAANQVVTALSSGKVRMAAPWANDHRWAIGRNEPAATCIPLIQSYACEIRVPTWQHFYHDGTRDEARRLVDERLRAAGWLLCGDAL